MGGGSGILGLYMCCGLTMLVVVGVAAALVWIGRRREKQARERADNP